MLAVRRPGRVAAASSASAVRRTEPKRSTEEARSYGIVGLAGSYQTYYGGDANRIHNVQLVAHLVDRHLIAPGSTSSRRPSLSGTIRTPSA